MTESEVGFMFMGERIKQKRKSLNLTQEELAGKMGVSYQAVSKWENDASMPDTAILPALANALDTNLDYLFTGKGDETAEKRVEW